MAHYAQTWFCQNVKKQLKSIKKWIIIRNPE